MPHLKPPSAIMPPLPSDTGIPGLSRRRVWAAPEVRSHAVVVLTLPRLYLAAGAGVPKPETLAAIETTFDVEAALGPLTTAIDLATIRRVRLDLVANSLTLDYIPARSNRSRAVIRFATAEPADAIFSKLWRRLGPEFRLSPVRADVGELSRLPLAVMFGLAIGTALSATVLNAITDYSHALGWSLTEYLPSWRTVSALGGAGVAATQVWLYRRLSRPPERLELQKE